MDTYYIIDRYSKLRYYSNGYYIRFMGKEVGLKKLKKIKFDHVSFFANFKCFFPIRCGTLVAAKPCS